MALYLKWYQVICIPMYCEELCRNRIQAKPKMHFICNFPWLARQRMSICQETEQHCRHITYRFHWKCIFTMTRHDPFIFYEPGQPMPVSFTHFSPETACMRSDIWRTLAYDMRNTISSWLCLSHALLQSLLPSSHCMEPNVCMRMIYTQINRTDICVNDPNSNIMLIVQSIH